MKHALDRCSEEVPNETHLQQHHYGGCHANGTQWPVHCCGNALTGHIGNFGMCSGNEISLRRLDGPQSGHRFQFICVCHVPASSYLLPVCTKGGNDLS
jgi:hypothetical protein